MVISFVCLVSVRLLRPSMAVLYHDNGKLQRAYFDILKFILGLEAWGNKTKEMYRNNGPITIVQVSFPLRDSARDARRQVKSDNILVPMVFSYSSLRSERERLDKYGQGRENPRNEVWATSGVFTAVKREKFAKAKWSNSPVTPSVDGFVDTATQNAAVSRNFDIFAACLTRRHSRYNLRRYNLRSRNATLLVPADARCLPTLGHRAFQSAAPKLWNSLPVEIRNIQGLTSFERALKTYFFKIAL